jgi:hypothetical protein
MNVRETTSKVVSSVRKIILRECLDALTSVAISRVDTPVSISPGLRFVTVSPGNLSVQPTLDTLAVKTFSVPG